MNYTDQNTNKVIYTDYLRGNVGDKVTVKDISSIEGYNNFKMSNQQVAGNYIIKQDNEILNVNISEKDPFIIVLKQNDGNIILTTKLITKFGNPIDTNQLNYLSDNLADVDSFNINYENNLQSLTKSQLEDLTTTQNITTPSQLVGTLINSADAVVSDGENGLSGKNMEMTLNYNINNPYKNIHITYQNEDGTIIEQKDLTDNSTSIEASDLVKSNLPNDYALINQDIPYLIHDITNNNVNLISIVKKTINSNDNDHSDNNSTSTSPDVISIESTIGTHPAALTKINIYDNNGYLTDKTVAPNSNWYTDREMLIKGTKYYRIATDQWLKIDDVYIYQNNPVYLSTYSDTAKHLVNSQNLKVNREVAANSDWYSDRYAYFDNQKYYRLATNEWVNANDVYEYKPVDQTVQPNSSAILFDDRYNPVRTIVNSIALKTDKTANIKGSNMYHVATNEWLPVSETK